MEIRRMTEHDVEQVALLEREIFSDAWSAAAFYESLENPNAILLLSGKWRRDFRLLLHVHGF